MPENPPLNALHSELAAAGLDAAEGGDFLRGILAGCGDCIKILDMDGCLQFMSEGGKRVMEVDDFSALKGCPWPSFWSGEGNGQALAAVAAAKDGKVGRFRNAANTAKGTPRYWDVQVSPILGSDGKPSHLLSISRDITEEWEASQAQKESFDRQQFLTEELTHRVKNTLATVIAIASQTFRDEIYKERRAIFISRVRTLDDAYKILTEASWSSTSIGRVVESALAAYSVDHGRIVFSGPAHDLRPTQALTLALAVNELATNAMKYGALSNMAGRVSVTWAIQDSTLTFTWRESGGPAVTPPTRSGFGSRLVKTMLAGDFGGSVDLLYQADGLACVLTAPVARQAEST